jgi:fructosamine-3-kinase
MASTSLAPDLYPEMQLTKVLADAIDQNRLPAHASEILSFSQHLNSPMQQQFVVHTDAGDYFIKLQPLTEETQTQCRAEYSGLLTIAASRTIRTAIPLAVGHLDNAAYIVLQHLPLAVHGDWQQAGEQLAQLHSQAVAERYGFDQPTFCGFTMLDNRWQTNWARFFCEQRLSPLAEQLHHRGERLAGLSTALPMIENRLLGHQPEASLLHGDLWSGNIGFVPEPEGSVPVIYDPACYYGDSETDLAMTELFGRFPQTFYQGYHSVRPIDDDYEERRPVYQLFHLLNHAVLFGGHYLTQARDLLRQLQ